EGDQDRASASDLHGRDRAQVHTARPAHLIRCPPPETVEAAVGSTARTTSWRSDVRPCPRNRYRALRRGARGLFVIGVEIRRAPVDEDEAGPDDLRGAKCTPAGRP